MFCDERVINVFLCSNDDLDGNDSSGANAYFDFITQLVYHVTEGYRMLLETENYMISMGVDGIKKLEKAEFTPDEHEWMRPGIEATIIDRPFVHEEHTLFVGERLQESREEGGIFYAVFDNFEMKIVPYNLNCMPIALGRNDHGYAHIKGYDRHLNRVCNCGGKGEILIDFVDDYVVRCNKCHISTCASMVLADAISDWNEGDTPYRISIVEDIAPECWQGHIEYIAVSRKQSWPISDQSCDCKEIIIKVDEQLFTIEHRYTATETGSFGFRRISSFNEALYTSRVVSSVDEPITFLNEIRQANGMLSGLKFKCGNRFLFVYSLEYNLTLTKSVIDLEAEHDVDDLPAIDDSVLFNT